MRYEHANAASKIRKELKIHFPGVKFSVRSRSYAGGASVYVSWTDGPTEDAVRNIVSKYEKGYFDAMTDAYYYTNRRDDLPQVEFVQLRRELSPKKMIELLQEWGYDVSEDELYNEDETLFREYKVRTYYQLAWRIAKMEGK